MGPVGRPAGAGSGLVGGEQLGEGPRLRQVRHQQARGKAEGAGRGKQSRQRAGRIATVEEGHAIGAEPVRPAHRHRQRQAPAEADAAEGPGGEKPSARLRRLLADEEQADAGLPTMR